MRRTVTDATEVTRKALLGTDGGWYEAYWYADGAETEPRLLPGLAGGLAIISRAIRRPGRPVAGSLPPQSMRFGGAPGSLLRSMTRP